MNPDGDRSTPRPWVVAAGIGLVVCAARLATVRHGTCDAPFLDQWRSEAERIIAPWETDTLVWTDFFTPENGSFPVWSRLLVWVQVAVLRCWDPVVQCSVNAALCGAFVAAVAAWLHRQLATLPALLAVTLACFLYGLPHSWENTIWGLQSSVPLCLLFSFWHMVGALRHPTGSRAWWLAQFAGVAALGTLGGAWGGPLAVAAVALWNSPGDWRRWLAPALIASAGLALLACAPGQPPVDGTPDATSFLGAAVTQAGWPLDRPFAAAVVFLPAFLLWLQIRSRPDARHVDLAAVALALFALSQAASFGYGHSAGHAGFASRQSDLLAVGVLANGLAVWRLGAARMVPRWLAFGLAVIWLGVIAAGLQAINQSGDTLLFRKQADSWRWQRETTLKQFLATRDEHLLGTEAARSLVCPEPETVSGLVAVPGVVDLLPPSLRADPAPRPGDAVGIGIRLFLECVDYLGWAGGALLLFACTLPAAAATSPEPPHARDALRAPIALGVALLCGSAASLWPAPFLFDPEARLIRLISSQSPVPDFSFHIVTPSPYPPDNLEGGALLLPENFRNHYFGTHIDGPAFTGRAESSVFVLTSAYLVVPFAGYPATPGNALLLEVLDDHGRVAATYRCGNRNPDPVGFWPVDVRELRGKKARLVILDGQSSGRESWVAAAAPLQAPANLAPTLESNWQAEQTAGARVSLALLSLAALAAAGAAWLRRHPAAR